MKAFLILLFAFLFDSIASAQSKCIVSLLSSKDLEVSRSDSSWNQQLDAQISYYVSLRKDIMPKYWDLQKKLLNLIEKDDFSKLSYLKGVYLKQIDSYLEEMRSTNERVVKNLRPSSEIANLLIFETLRAYPDTWALLINPDVINRNVNNADKVIINELYKKYSKKLEPLQECVRMFKVDRENNLRKYPVPQILQGNKGGSDSNICGVADLLLWTMSSSY